MKGTNKSKNSSKNENNKNEEKENLLNKKNINQNEQNDFRMNDAFDKERLKHSKNLYDTPDENKRIMFNQQRHLYEHKKDKKDPLINIYSKPLQEEYMNEVNYILKNSNNINIIININFNSSLSNFKTF